MSNVQVLLPSGNLKPLGGPAASAVEAAAASTSVEGCFPRPPLRRPAPRDSESDSSAYPQPKKLRKTRRRNKKKKSKRVNIGVVRICKPYAPFNSNQFLMEEYDTLHYEDIDMYTSSGSRLEQECGGEAHAVEGAPSAGGDGEDVQWEEFCKKEFLGTYQAITVQRLDNLTKAQLVEEYLTLEDELDELKQRLEEVTKEDQARGMIIDCDPDSSDLQPGEVLLDAETAAKISVFKDEIKALEIENKRLQEENARLRRSRTSSSSSSSSSDSWSSSSSSSSSSDSSSSDSEDEKGVGDDNNNHSTERDEAKAAPAPLDQLSASVNMTCEVIQCSEDSGSSAAGHESSVGSLLPVDAGSIASWVEGSEEVLLQVEQVSVFAGETVTADSAGAVKCVEDNNLDVQNELLDSGLDNNDVLSEDNDS